MESSRHVIENQKQTSSIISETALARERRPRRTTATRADTTAPAQVSKVRTLSTPLPRRLNETIVVGGDKGSYTRRERLLAVVRRAAAPLALVHPPNQLGPRLAVGLAAARHAVHLLLGLLLEEARAVLGRLAIEALLVARRRPRRRPVRRRGSRGVPPSFLRRRLSSDTLRSFNGRVHGIIRPTRQAPPALLGGRSSSSPQRVGGRRLLRP